MSGPRDTSDPSFPGGTGACYLADARRFDATNISQDHTNSPI